MYEEGLAEKIATLKLQLAARNELRYPKKPLTNPAHSRSESEMYEDMDDGPPRWVSELSKMDGEGDGKRTEMPTIAGAAPSGDVQESFGQLRAKVTAMEQQLFGRAAAALRARVSPMTEESISAMQSRRAFLEAQIEISQRKQEFKKFMNSCRSLDSATNPAETLRRTRSVETVGEQWSSGGHTPFDSGSFTEERAHRRKNRLESQSARALAQELHTRLHPETKQLHAERAMGDDDGLHIQQRRLKPDHETECPPAVANVAKGGRQPFKIILRTRSLPSIHDHAAIEQTRSVGETFTHSVLPSTTLERTRSVGERYGHSVLPDMDDMFKMIRRNSLLSKADLSFQSASLKCIMSAADGMIDQLNYFLVAQLANVPRDKLPQKIYETFTKMDLDGSGHLTKDEVGAAFEKLGKPLSGDELDKWMESVDVDGNGWVDAFEFEHMTRCLLGVECEVSCPTCRFLHQSAHAKKTDNWGKNKEAAIGTLKKDASSSRPGTASSPLREHTALSSVRQTTGQSQSAGAASPIRQLVRVKTASAKAVDLLQVEVSPQGPARRNEGVQEQSAPSTTVQTGVTKKPQKRVTAVWRNSKSGSGGEDETGTGRDAPRGEAADHFSSRSPAPSPEPETQTDHGSSLATLPLPVKAKTRKFGLSVKPKGGSEKGGAVKGLQQSVAAIVSKGAAGKGSKRIGEGIEEPGATKQIQLEREELSSW